ARIKKIMQADEDVGKIAMAVPVLVSKALELFLQDLCDRTYDITLQRGAKTMSSLHLKHCIHSFSMFDFLKDVVSKVPDYGNSEANADDRTAMKRRKSAVEEYHDSDEELKKSRMVVRGWFEL
uniref:Transcription factor CBF/NF-Y/archaeal histone domain-containing protein n=1 Tax=Chenopodium quinoa TaxID=63459 RepID=A0A803MMR4_CHEQI